ncbi:uncharacterized protein J3D65DRAFT_619635 [Phyllosticta citribraziliensis]|uniref:Uncharacterized protein n=1 Tax=Phyllosticta citribraziliensis TaxID=989973 RepID=A0ABR1LX51_9PEZI
MPAPALGDVIPRRPVAREETPWPAPGPLASGRLCRFFPPFPPTAAFPLHRRVPLPAPIWRGPNLTATRVSIGTAADFAVTASFRGIVWEEHCASSQSHHLSHLGCTTNSRPRGSLFALGLTWKSVNKMCSWLSNAETAAPKKSETPAQKYALGRISLSRHESAQVGKSRLVLGGGRIHDRLVRPQHQGPQLDIFGSKPARCSCRDPALAPAKPILTRRHTNDTYRSIASGEKDHFSNKLKPIAPSPCPCSWQHTGTRSSNLPGSGAEMIGASSAMQSARATTLHRSSLCIALRLWQ